MSVHRPPSTVHCLFVTLLSACCLLLSIPSVSSQEAPSPQTSLATGQTISLDLKGVDILDVLKLLSQKSGLSFVAGHNVTGRVTIFAKDVGVWDAFELIVSANDLAYERQGDIVNVMTARDYELLYGEKFQERKRNHVIPLKFAKAIQLATVLNQLKSNIGQVVVDEASNTVILHDVPSRLEEMREIVKQLDRPTETRIYTLNYATAEKLKEKIQEFLTPGVGTFSVDARTNKVIVTDLAETAEKIDRIIRALDEREGEVLIEAKIVKVDLTDEQSLGVDWQQVFAGIDLKTRANFRVLNDIVDTSSPATGAVLKLLTAPKANTQLILEALKKFGKVETIANPRITVSNNQEAKILVGTKEAFVTTTTTIPTSGPTINAPQVQFVDVGTKLFVTPNIKSDGHVQLKVRPEVSSVDKTITDIANTRIPIVSTTEAETNVLVRSGTTLVIGGLIDTRFEDTKNQLPGLGDLPLLGTLFRSRVKKNNKTERVVFLTPQIISASGDRLTEFPSAGPVERVVQADTREGAVLPASYQAIVRDMLSRALAKELESASLGEGSVTVAFLLSHAGRVIGSPEITSPQGEMFVKAARSAVEKIGPFPPFPEGVTASEVRLRLAVDYRP